MSKKQKRAVITKVGDVYVVDYNYYSIEARVLENFDLLFDYLKTKFEGKSDEDKYLEDRIKEINERIEKS